MPTNLTNMQYLLVKVMFLVVFVFHPVTNNSFVLQSKSNDLLVNHEYNLELYSKDIYNSLQTDDLSYDVFEKAIRGYIQLKRGKELKNPDILCVIDFSKSSKEKRLFVIDLKAKKILFHELVAHGTNTGVEYAKFFSNTRHSNKSSLGFFITGKPYNGKRGYSLKLFGMEAGFNTNAFVRGVVMHGARYVSEKFVRQNGRLGRSFGCTAVSEEVNYSIIQTIKNGTCMFIYFPDKEYLSKSKYLESPILI